jgi:hypothetical protein
MGERRGTLLPSKQTIYERLTINQRERRLLRSLLRLSDQADADGLGASLACLEPPRRDETMAGCGRVDTRA